MTSYNLTTPISDEIITSLKAGDTVHIRGIIVTGRDMAHKYLVNNFVNANNPSETASFEKLNDYLRNGIIYHCGPIVQKTGDEWRFISAGPTTSIREEIYQYDVVKLFNLAGVIGKGGMGKRTLEACSRFKCVYLHAIGGAGALIAQNVKQVVEIIKPEFGTPESFWVIEVENFPCLVTMDSHGTSLHEQVAAESKKAFEEIVK